MKKFKLYSIISVLIAVILFSTAALCNQCAITPPAVSGTSFAIENKTSETITETSDAKETIATTATTETTTAATIEAETSVVATAKSPIILKWS